MNFCIWLFSKSCQFRNLLFKLQSKLNIIKLDNIWKISRDFLALSIYIRIQYIQLLQLFLVISNIKEFLF